MNDDLRLVREGSISTLVLNRPDKRNAITIGMWQTLPHILRTLEDDSGIRVVVVRGAGTEAFASGADISEFEQVRATVETARVYITAVKTAEQALANFSRPTIAMIHGACVGGGLELALACDVRWADRTARFGITAARLGIVYSLSATRRLASIVGPGRARDLLFSARLIDAEEALAMGLINAVREPTDLEEATYAYARLLATQAPLTQQGAKLMLQDMVGEGGMTESDLASVVEQAYASDDYREGVRAFLEKRPPRFTGQ